MTTAVESRPSWWRRVFKRQRYDPRADRRVSALPPRLDLKLSTTPMASRLDVNFANAGQSTVSLDVLPTEPRPTSIPPSKSMPDAKALSREPPPPLPIAPAAVAPISSGHPEAQRSAPPASPSSPGFSRKLHSTTRASETLASRTQNMPGYSVTTYVPVSVSAASSADSSSSSKRESGESGSASQSERALPETSAPVRASEESAFYSTHDEVPPSVPVMQPEPVHQRPEPVQPQHAPAQAVQAQVVQPEPVEQVVQPVSHPHHVVLFQQQAVQPEPVHEAQPQPQPIHHADFEPQTAESSRLPVSPPRPPRSPGRPSAPLAHEPDHEHTADDYASDDAYDYSDTREGEYDYSDSPEQHADMTFGRGRTAVAY
ncbi:hypothetical protein CC85DRAFT_311224 [Cutaneotrichosporon oleaginosum]|uniref:Uncharacterized protein n=1 Tax=Cutaneotrichosporon oleaginosum TaxID=879819 RepID=A0A0J0XSX1_9TREE|nr:uncharacterized protein CC85DRAFT_311224 [Cutaneotrichosporon oleaginosum]KLT44183.1 hypothetical protein CC85DRAFT_311224 [Cutaneotrichosporon oleaginosum]